VTTFLVNFFEKYVEYDFTAELEEDLDDISSGDAKWKKVLADFWEDFSAQVEQVKGLTITDVIDALDNELEPFLFPKTDENPNPRACPSCEDGRLGLKLGKFGAFIGCSNYDDCKYTREFAFTTEEKLKEQGEEDGINLDAGPVELGSDPDTGKIVTLRKGPYGVYVQLGETEKDEETGKKKKPKRSSVPKSFDIDDMDLDTALGLLGLPRTVGEHPETGKEILAGIGRYGPYLKYDGNYTSLPKGENVLTVGMNRAVDLIARSKKKKKRGPIKTLGEHPDDGKKITVHTGRYGPYLKYGKQNVSLPNSVDPEDVTMDLAVATIAKYKSKKKQKKNKK
jgi:DNA topoisomerase-1